MPWLNEACLLLEEGAANAAQIDAIACKAFRIGLGPFGLMNLTGPPIALHSTDYLAEQLNTPRYTGAANLRALVEANAQWDISEDATYTEEQYRSCPSGCSAWCLVLPHKSLKKTFAAWKTLIAAPRSAFVGLEVRLK